MKVNQVGFILHPSSFPRAVYFLLHFPYPCAGPKAELGRWALPTTEVRWSPDFPLSAMNCFIVDSDRPADSWRLYYFSRIHALSAGIAHRICLTPGSRGLYTEAGANLREY